MKKTYRFATMLIIVALGAATSSPGQTITDYDGHIYQIVEIGEQLWLGENLKSLHYSDGTPIPDVRAYNNSSATAETYGRLYTWDAAMNGAVQEGAQGACPGGWHVPSDADWKKLANQLGGVAVAGGKLKEAGTDHWKSPNTGATNSSGFTALPSGEHDTEKYQLMHEYCVLWSSTGGAGNWVQYMYLAYDDAKLHENYYDKTFYYSVRCVKDKATGTNDRTYRGLLIYPNPFDHLLHIDQQEKYNDKKSEVQIFNQSGQLITSFTMTDRLHQENLQFLSSGIYFLKINTDHRVIYQKILKK